ncbi:hypothetical protein [Nocardia sp. CA-145437]|uniref:hypothetical protein n=1 Tax=Nocardia sp. CA-145437 TaxID=3239980 RepID=UPI003D953B8C
MLVGLVPLVAVVLGRVISVRGRRVPLLTLGLAAIAVAFVVRLSVVDKAIDPHIATAANLTDLWHVLLAGAAWWALGALSLPVIVEHPRVRDRLEHLLDAHRRVRLAGRTYEDAAVHLWTAANLVATLAAWSFWFLGDVSRVEVDDMMHLHDTGTVALTWLYLAWAFTGGLIVTTAALISLPDPEAPRLVTGVMLGIGICGIGISITGAAFLIVDSAALESNFPLIMAVWGIPGLLLLAMFGFLTAAQRSDDADVD